MTALTVFKQCLSGIFLLKEASRGSSKTLPMLMLRQKEEKDEKIGKNLQRADETYSRME